MPTTNWNVTTIDGDEYLVIDTTKFRVPLDWDASSNMFIAVASPTGGLGNFPALVKGDQGDTPIIDTTINLTALDADDQTADSATWTEISPGTYQLTLVLHKGPEGDPGDTTIDFADFSGTPLPGRILVVNAGITAFEFAAQKAGDRYVPAEIANTPTGNPKYTLCSVAVPAQPFDWRPVVSGYCIVARNAYASTVDLVARLNDETSGNEVGRAAGYSCTAYDARAKIPLSLTPGPPTNASTNYDRVAAGQAAVIYLRAERQAGSGTFTTTADTTRFCVWVQPIP